MLLTIDTLPEFTGFTVVSGLISLLVFALLIAFENERQRRAKHRLIMQRRLHHIRSLPSPATFRAPAPRPVLIGRR